MAKKMYDSWFDSNPVYIVLGIAHVWILLAWVFGWTFYGLNAQAASTGWHVAAVICMALSWLIMALGKTERTIVDFDYSFWIWAFIILYVTPFLFLCGFTYNIA